MKCSIFSKLQSISFCHRQFSSPSIRGRARVGGRGELRKTIFTHPEELGEQEEKQILTISS